MSEKPAKYVSVAFLVFMIGAALWAVGTLIFLAYGWVTSL